LALLKQPQVSSSSISILNFISVLFFFSIDSMASRIIRGRAYTSSEDALICQSWIAITQDPLIGTDQSGSQFWDRVYATFVTLLGTSTDRTAGSLSSRFNTISKEVALFIAKLGNIISRAASGTTEADKVIIFYCVLLMFYSF
jgi:hypothetical protein